MISLQLDASTVTLMAARLKQPWLVHDVETAGNTVEISPVDDPASPMRG
ncbi:hypothetical protein AB0D27_12860 [Streptomyces sp. NPDC048415]|jgi:hypothetical protein